MAGRVFLLFFFGGGHKSLSYNLFFLGQVKAHDGPIMDIAKAFQSIFVAQELGRPSSIGPDPSQQREPQCRKPTTRRLKKITNMTPFD